MKLLTTPRLHADALRTALLAICLLSTSAFAAKPVPSSGVDLDITGFRATSKVILSSRNKTDISVELSVRNNGSLNETRLATLVGRSRPGNNLVFQTQFVVFDRTGGKSTRFTVVPTDMGFMPSAGVVNWEVLVEDDSADDDRATATTTVRP